MQGVSVALPKPEWDRRTRHISASTSHSSLGGSAEGSGRVHLAAAVCRKPFVPWMNPGSADGGLSPLSPCRTQVDRPNHSAQGWLGV